MSHRSELGSIAAVAQLLALVLTVGTLYFARDVFIPLALALLLSFLLSPLVNRLQRWGVSNVLAVLATALCAFVLLSAGLILVGREISALIGELPQYKEELVTKARSVAGIRSGMGSSLDDLAEEVNDAIEEADQEKAALEEEMEDASQVDQGSPLDVQADASEGWGASSLGRWTGRLFDDEKDRQEKIHDGTSASRAIYITEVNGASPLLSWAGTIGTVLGPLGTAGLVSVFTLFLLVHRDDLRDRMIAVISHGNYVTTTEALTEAARRISRYLIAQTIVNSSYGFVLATGLYIIGWALAPTGEFPNFALWGALAGALRFIPYLGPIVGALFPLALALAVFPGYYVFGAVLGLIVVMELLSNNVLEPWLYGSSTGLSAVAVIMAAVFWGWLWGPVGLLLSTPLTACLVVLGRHVPRFKIFTTLLSDEVQIRPWLRFYQRLLANDEQKAIDLLKQYQVDHTRAHMGDEMLVPTLKRLQTDCDNEQLSDADKMSMLGKVEEIIERLGMRDGDEAEAREEVDKGDVVAAEASAVATASRGAANAAPEEVLATDAASVLPAVVACGAHDLSDELVARALAQACREHCEITVLEHHLLPNALAEQIAESQPAVVVITVLPPGGFVQARYLCRALRKRGYTKPVVVACFGKFKKFDLIFSRFRKAGATTVTTSMTQTDFKLKTLLGRSKLVNPPMKTYHTPGPELASTK